MKKKNNNMCNQKQAKLVELKQTISRRRQLDKKAQRKNHKPTVTNHPLTT